MEDDDRTVLVPARAGAPAPAGGGNVLPPGTKLHEFEITGLVGEGGFGIVYHAFDHTLQREVALKEYMPRALAARAGALRVAVQSEQHAETYANGLRGFVNEARLLARFDHPSLLKVYRFWEGNGTAYMVMPFYEGVTLKRRLDALASPPGEHWLKDMLRPLVDAIAVLHGEQCFHRDIAPDNILILKDGRPMLLDFGAARRVIGDMTQALTAILKPGFAPIEQYAESSDVKQGPWTDIYALAAVVYFAIAGKAPATSVARMMTETLEPLSVLAAGRYSAEFLRGIDRALALLPKDRPQRAVELFALWDLDEQLRLPDASGTVAAPPKEAQADNATPTVRLDSPPVAAKQASALPATSGARPDRTNARVTMFVIAAVVLTAIVAGAAFMILIRKGAEPPPAIVVPAQPPPATATVAPPPATTPAASPPAAATVAPPPATTPAAPPPARATVAPPPTTLPAAPPPETETVGPPVATPSAVLPAPEPAPAPTTSDSATGHDGRRMSPTQGTGKASHPTGARSERCVDILQRASLGEILTADEQALLKKECK